MKQPARRRVATSVVAFCLLGAAVSAAGALSATWPLLAAWYDCAQIDAAPTFDEARPWLEALAERAKAPAVAKSVVAKLGRGQDRLEVWLYTWLWKLDRDDSPALVSELGRAIRSDERLCARWSHYVRWREGESLWPRLARTCCRPDEPRPNFPCGVGDRWECSAGPRPELSLRAATDSAFGAGSASVRDLSALGLAWFAGMWPLPKPDAGAEATFTRWLRALEPFQRDLAFNAKLGRCYRDTEREPLPTLDLRPCSRLLLAEVPVPTWSGPSPVISPLAEFRVTPAKGGDVDILWPNPSTSPPEFTPPTGEHRRFQLRGGLHRSTGSRSDTP
ncbi:MAG TPA: hypothetical protein VFD71_16000 [Planctomycetota bacterium]|nr:hypothetical protein [Planctomycetota bacterium]